MARRRRRSNPGMGLNIGLGVAALAMVGGAMYCARESLAIFAATADAKKTKNYQLAAGGLLLGGIATSAALGSTWGAWGAAGAPIGLVAATAAVGAMIPVPKAADAPEPKLEGSGLGLPLFP